jgi:dUTP pyrophosphatase
MDVFNKPVKFATNFSACFDIESTEDVILVKNKPVAVPTGLFISDNISASVLAYCYISILSRSGLSLKGVSVLNAPGIVDLDFRDEIKVILNYVGDGEFKLPANSRVAQGMINSLSYEQKMLRGISNVLFGANNRVGGFGSTGA